MRYQGAEEEEEEEEEAGQNINYFTNNNENEFPQMAQAIQEQEKYPCSLIVTAMKSKYRALLTFSSECFHFVSLIKFL